MSQSRAKDIFLDALDLPEPQRAAFIERACAGDADLIAAVEALMGTHRQAAAFLARTPSPTVGAPASAGGEENIGDVIDRYQLIRKLGEGGFGVVFLAQQREPMERQVALKVIKRGMDSKQIVQRFELERQTLAVMDHPNIARVFDAGSTQFGQPYFVMEYVDGQPITHFCDTRKLNIRQRLELIEKVCLAVQHAHTRGVIHRDLKPGNILVTEVDGEPEPKVIDFGIAKATDPDSTAAPAMTQEMQIVGTPQYMSPEQAKMGGTRSIDTRSDVYSIGTILYELVAGVPPFDPKSLRAAGIDKVLQIIREDAPPKPSTRVIDDPQSALLPSTHGLPPQQLRKQIAGEVDWIVMKALEKEPQRRYQSAADFAADIRRHLENQAVEAGPPSAFYQMRKFARRHRLPITAATVVALAIITTAIVATVMAARARAAEAVAKQNEKTAQIELARATAISNFTEKLLNGVTPAVARGRDSTLLRDVLDRAVAELPKNLDNQALPNLIVRNMVAGAIYALGDPKAGAELLEPAYTALANTDLAKHPERLRAAVTLSTLYEESRQGEKAEPIIRETIAAYDARGPSDKKNALGARVALAGILKQRGADAEAMALLEECVKAYRDAGLERDEQALTAANNLANSYQFGGKLKEALALWQHVLELQKAEYGADHPNTLGTMNNIATTLRDFGRYDEAEAMYREVLANERRIYQVGHPMLIKTLVNYGALQADRDQLEEADKLISEATEMIRNSEAGRPFKISLAVQTMKLRTKQKRYDEAAEIAKEMFELSAKDYGANDRRAVAWIAFRIDSLTDAGRYDEAKALVDSAPMDVINTLPSNNQQSFHAAAGLLHFAMGNRPAAEASYERAKKFSEIDSSGRERAVSTFRDLKNKLTPPATSPTSAPATLPSQLQNP